MFVYNRCTTDARVLKEAATLARAGHRVRVIAVLDDTTEPEEEHDGFRIVRIDRRPIHYRALRMGRVAAGVAKRNIRPGARSPLAVLLAPLAALAAVARRLLLAPHKPLMFLDYYWRAYRLVRTDPPDALHAHDLNTLPVAAALAARLGLPLTYDAHELYPEISTLSRREAAVWRLVEKRLARRADHVLTVCESIAGELTRRYGVVTPVVLLNCPAAGLGRPGSAEATEGAGGSGTGSGAENAPTVDLVANIPTNSTATGPIVLYQGGFAPHRGLEALVRAAGELERGTVLLMGWGSLESDLRALIERESLDERVMIVGPVSRHEVVPRAAEATIGVIPYEPVGLNNTYTTPNKLFDYMSAGLPIVASRLPELTRFVEGEEVGLTFSPGDPAALADTLNRLLADPTRRDHMRERAREAAARYTWEKESEKLLGLYRPQQPAHHL